MKVSIRFRLWEDRHRQEAIASGLGKIKKRSRTFSKVMVDHKMGASLAEDLGSPTA
jgi:hypothetical protein